MSDFYPDLENNYPNKIDEYNPLSDVTASTYDIAKQYETYLSLGNTRDENGYTGLQKAAKYKEENPILDKMIINAKKYNILQQMIISTQRFARSLKFQTVFSISQPDTSDNQMNGGIWAKIKDTLENGEKKVLLKHKDNNSYYNFYPQTTGDQVVFEDGDNCENFKSSVELFKNDYDDLKDSYNDFKKDFENHKHDDCYYTEKEIDAKFNRIIDMVYPIGSIYTSTKNVSPASFIGGTWTPIKDTFLLCAGDKYKAESSGGSAAKTVPLPVHNHRFTPAGSVSSNANSVDGGHTHTIPNHSHDVSLYSSIEQDSISVKLRTNSPNDTDGSWNTSVVHFGKGSATYVNSNAIDLSVSAHRHTIQGSTSNVISSNNTSRNGSQISTTVSSSFKGTAGTTENAGSDATIDIMPPYKTVYAWERTA